MRRVRFKIDDPDGFIERMVFDDEGHDAIYLKEGELPLRPPKLYYVEEPTEEKE